MKKEGKVYKGEAKPKADVAIILSDDTFVQLSQGKVQLLWFRILGGSID